LKLQITTQANEHLEVKPNERNSQETNTQDDFYDTPEENKQLEDTVDRAQEYISQEEEKVDNYDLLLNDVNNLEILSLKSSIDELTEQIDYHKRMLVSEKKNSSVYARFFNQMKGIEKEDKEIQTEEIETPEFHFFQQLLEESRLQCIANNHNLAKGFKLKDKQKKELIMDFFKFKIDIKNKIQYFINKHQKALNLQVKIEKYTQIREEEEKNKVEKEKSMLEEEKRKILNEFEKWNQRPNDEKTNAIEHRVWLKSRMSDMDNNDSFAHYKSELESISNKEDNSFINEISQYEDLTPQKYPLKHDILLKKSNLLPLRKQTIPSTSFKIPAKKPIPLISPLKNQSTFQSSKKLNSEHKQTPIKILRKLTVDQSQPLIDPSTRSKNLPSQPKALHLPSLLITPIPIDTTPSPKSDLALDHHETVLEEELLEETECIEERELFEALVQRHSLLQRELEDGKQRIGLFGGRGDWNTYAVGDNREGKWGTGRLEVSMCKPTFIRKRFTDVSCGYHHSAAIDEDGVVYTWGRPEFGQLGQGEVGNQSVPWVLAQPLTQVEIIEVSCGWQHTLAMTIEGFVFSWGLNINGQLGVGDYDDRNTPQLIESIIVNKASKISAGHSHSAMIDQNCSLYTWGANPDGRLCRKISYYKLSMRPKSTNKPTLWTSVKKDRIVGMSLGFDHSLFLREDGVVYACGNPNKGQLGDKYYHPEKSEEPYFAHYLFSSKNDKWVQVGAGDGFSVFRSEKGLVYTWGEGNYGRLGNGGTVSMVKPMMVEFFRKNGVAVKDIQVGGRHTFAISEDNELYVWGFGYYYQLGNTSNDDCVEPQMIKFTKQIDKVSCGYFNSVIIVGDDDAKKSENDSNSS
jgi:alpha-tubulin suppressor-like RCC1 family protein